MRFVPRGWFSTTVLAVTGVLLLIHLGRLAARAALAYRKPARLIVSPGSVRLKWHTEILGRTQSERDVVLGPEGLVSVVREVRYPRLAFYAGLLFLAIGSFVGVRTLADGVRAASPSLLLFGLAVIALGVLLDVVFTSLVPGATGRCRLGVVPRAGPPIWVTGVDAERADAALTLLAKGAASSHAGA